MITLHGPLGVGKSRLADATRLRSVRPVCKQRAIMVIAIGVLAGVAVWGAPAARADVEASPLDAIFLGQAYEPSHFFVLGRASDSASSWPKRLTFRCMERDSRVRDRTGEFVREINGPDPPRSSETNRTEISSPAKPPLPVGFFATIDRSEVTDENIGHYTGTEPVSVQCPVVAFMDNVPLAALDFTQAGKPRPLNQREKETLQEERARVAKETNTVECTTEPGFLDKAEQLWTAKLTGTDRTIRLSVYQDPGCAGHLSAVYVLDLLQRGALKSSRAIRHYVGVL